MKDFMDKDFLLETETAKHLFHDYAENMPLVDYHCHISPKEIYEDRRFETLDQVWIGGKNPDGSYFGDHYKWRLMRSNGVKEEEITGSAPGNVKIKRFAESLEKAIGNPMYHWTNLELKKFFGFKVPLTPKNSDEAYKMCNEKLQKDFENFIEKLKIALKPYDAYYIGDFRDATFDESFIYDSPHHIDENARKIRTSHLIKYLKEFL